MKKAVLKKPGQVVVEDVAKPTIQADDDAIIKVVRASVCGSDLWNYRGIDAAHSDNSGHEAIGVVEAVGKAITAVKPGDFVICPFTHGCGHCAACLAGFEGGCLSHRDNFSSDNQAEYIRYQHAQWSLVKIPGKPKDYSDGMLASFQALSDVMPTGFHAAKSADVKPGATVVVVGDGAVGLCGVLSAHILGAKQIILMSRHADRQALGKQFGATDIVEERGEAGEKQVFELTHGVGADSVLECVGSKQAMQTALNVGRPGASVGRVGVPHDQAFDLGQTFGRNIKIAGGPASVSTYDKNILLQKTLEGQINPGLVFTKTFSIDEVQAAYAAMDERKAIKSLLKFD